MIDGYTDVAIVVSDAQKAKQWYTEKLGFKVVLERGHAICVSPNVNDGGSIVLHLCAGFSPPEAGNTGIGFTADDFDKTCEEFAQKGVEFSMKPTNEDGYKFAKFLDLDKTSSGYLKAAWQSKSWEKSRQLYFRHFLYSI